MLKRMSVDAVVSTVRHVVVEVWICTSRNLKCFIRTASRNDGVGSGDGRNNVLDNSLGKGVSDARDIEFFSSGQCLLVKPIRVLRIIRV